MYNQLQHLNRCRSACRACTLSKGWLSTMMQCHWECVLKQRIWPMCAQVPGFNTWCLVLSHCINQVTDTSVERKVSIKAASGVQWHETLLACRQLVMEHTKRATNHKELLDSLKLVNTMIQHAARLRLGAAKARVVTACRAAIKANNTITLLKIIREGRAWLDLFHAASVCLILCMMICCIPVGTFSAVTYVGCCSYTASLVWCSNDASACFCYCIYVSLLSYYSLANQISLTLPRRCITIKPCHQMYICSINQTEQLTGQIAVAPNKRWSCIWVCCHS